MHEFDFVFISIMFFLILSVIQPDSILLLSPLYYLIFDILVIIFRSQEFSLSKFGIGHRNSPLSL